jgi:hypothetical protein
MSNISALAKVSAIRRRRPAPQPDVRNFGWRDYGLRVGIWRIFDMMDEFKLPMCHLLNASVCEEMPQIAARVRQRGDEATAIPTLSASPTWMKRPRPP